MQTATALVVLLLAGSAWAAEVLTVTIEDPEMDATAGGAEVRRLLTIQHACPVSGTARLSVSTSTNLGARVYPAEITWQRCANQERSQVFAALFVKPPETTPAGVYQGSVTVTTPEGRTATEPFSVRLPYSASVTFQGAKITNVVPARTQSETFNVTVLANGATEVDLAIAAPPGWIVVAPDAVSTARGGPAQRIPWTVAVTPPADARGDTKIVFTATPRAASGGEEAKPVKYDWFARVPAQPAGGSGTADLAQAPVADEGLPVWAWGAGLVVASVIALWWSRR